MVIVSRLQKGRMCISRPFTRRNGRVKGQVKAGLLSADGFVKGAGFFGWIQFQLLQIILKLLVLLAGIVVHA